MGNFFTPVAFSSVVALQPLTNLLTTNYSTNSTVWWSNYSRTSNNNHTTECGHQINNMYGKNYFALLLLIIPSLTILGNALVVMSIVREKALQTTTNYLILSLAVADFLVAFCVMPFAVYVEVEESVWNLPKFLCNVFIASDVWASTASILNLVAVSWDRYMAVSSPIQYAQNSKKRIRIKATIFLVWFVSLVTALPMVTGINDLGQTDHCEFTHALYICISSVISFYLPCLIIIVLYSIVLKKLRRRKSSYSMSRPNRRKNNKLLAKFIPVECTEYDDITVYEVSKAENEGRFIAGSANRHTDDHSSMNTFNGDTPSVKDYTSCYFDTSLASSSTKATLSTMIPPLMNEHSLSVIPPLVLQNQVVFTQKLSTGKPGTTSSSDSPVNFTQSNESNIVLNFIHNKNNMARNGILPNKCGRRRESKRSRKERKATQTLAVVLGVFLICWLPFFTCHLTNSICKFRFKDDCIPLLAMFMTTWLGYINSLLNPIIYTVFNPTYRKAFKKLFKSQRKRYTR